MEKGGGLFVSPSLRSLPARRATGTHRSRSSMLIRPDGCIAWTDASAKPLDDALARWF